MPKSKSHPNEDSIIQSIIWAEKLKGSKQWQYRVVIAVYRYKDGKKTTRQQTVYEPYLADALEIKKAFWASAGVEQSKATGERILASRDFQDAWVKNTDQAILEDLQHEADLASGAEKLIAEARANKWADYVIANNSDETVKNASRTSRKRQKMDEDTGEDTEVKDTSGKRFRKTSVARPRKSLAKSKGKLLEQDDTTEAEGDNDESNQQDGEDDEEKEQEDGEES